MKKFFFRGRRMDNAEWVEGSLIVYNEDVYCIAVKTDFPDELKQFRVDPDTVSQCTDHWMPLPEPPEIGGDENE